MTSLAKRALAQQAAACVGVDAGKFSHALVVRPHGAEDSKPFAFPTTRAGFDEAVAYIRSLVPTAPLGDLLVGIEFAGSYGFTFAHYLDQLGLAVVSVLPASTKRWKDVIHGQPLKTDPKDALVIVDLLAQGQFVAFPFLKPAYADLRYLATARERLSLRRRAVISQVRSLLQVVFPEYEDVFPHLLKKTPLRLLRAYPSPQDLLAAPKRRVLKFLRTTSRGKVGMETYSVLVEAARATVGLPGAQSTLRNDIARALDRLTLYEEQITAIELEMTEALTAVPEAPYLLSIPMVAPVTAAIFLGSIGDPQAYEAADQVIKVAGLSLIERSSGMLHGTKRISKRGRPLLRAAAYMFAVRSVSEGGLFRAEYEALLERNGEKRVKALVAVMRSALRLMFSIARDRRSFTSEPPQRQHLYAGGVAV
jgi:transposase